MTSCAPRPKYSTTLVLSETVAFLSSSISIDRSTLKDSVRTGMGRNLSLVIVSTSVALSPSSTSRSSKRSCALSPFFQSFPYTIFRIKYMASILTGIHISSIIFVYRFTDQFPPSTAAASAVAPAAASPKSAPSIAAKPLNSISMRAVRTFSPCSPLYSAAVSPFW